MGRHPKTAELIKAATEILATHHPQTVRQVFYQLASRQVIENSRSTYQSVSKALVSARCDGTIPWEQIEDRLRRPRQVNMWDGLRDFASTAASSPRSRLRMDLSALATTRQREQIERRLLIGALTRIGRE